MTYPEDMFGSPVSDSTSFQGYALQREIEAYETGEVSWTEATAISYLTLWMVFDNGDPKPEGIDTEWFERKRLEYMSDPDAFMGSLGDTED